MANDIWNFPCWTARDRGPDEPRNKHGNLFQLNTVPFTDSITAIFSVLIRTGWTSQDGAVQGIGSVGIQGETDCRFRISTNDHVNGGGRVGVNIVAYDQSQINVRHNVHLGDENGVDWMLNDKWYQVAVSINSSGIQYAVNGTLTPKMVISTNDPGNISLGGGRAWMVGPNAAINQTDPILISVEWPTMIFGASAYSTQALDLSDPVVLARIYDGTGNFKKPGEDGSLWFGDVYGADTPEFYFTDGTPIHQNGTDLNAWTALRGGGAGFTSCPGGLKKQYESPFPDSTWLYYDLSEAEASGDAWQDGDEIRTTKGSVFIYSANAAVSGYSGLVHKYPFGTAGLGVFDSTDTKGSELADSDPDAWTDYGITDFGTDGVDYINDTDANLSRIRNITDSGAVLAESNYILTSNDVEVFRIMDDVDIPTVPGADSTMFFELSAWIDASNYEIARVYPFSGPWHYIHTNTATGANTTRTSTTLRRIWMYLKNGRMAIWFDEDIAPINANTIPAPVVGSSVKMSTINAGQIANSPYTLRIGTDVFGMMVTV